MGQRFSGGQCRSACLYHTSRMRQSDLERYFSVPGVPNAVIRSNASTQLLSLAGAGSKYLPARSAIHFQPYSTFRGSKNPVNCPWEKKFDRSTAANQNRSTQGLFCFPVRLSNHWTFYTSKSLICLFDFV